MIHPVEVTLCTSRIVRVRLGEAAPGATSYVGSRTWSEAAHCSAPGRVNTGEITVTVAEGYLEFGNRSGVMQLLLTLDETHIRPQRRVRLQTLGEQHFYGLGEGGQQFDRLGAVRRFWNFQSNRGLGADIAIPLLLSHLGYGLFFDSAAAATLQPGDAADGTWIEYHADAGPLDLYFIGGSSLRQVLGDVATLLGPATMPPRWALGYMQSSRHFTDAAEVRDLAAQFRTRRLPCDALIFLSSYGPAKGWNRGVGHLEFEPDLFANPEAILGEFGEEHFRIITHEYPVLHEASPLYAEAQANGYLLDTAYPRLLPQQPTAPVYKDGQRLIDFSKPEARSWWWRAHRPLADLGVAGWWLDGGEGPAGEVHNRYDLLRQQAFADGEALDRPDQRPFLLCRSGGPGMQRFGAAPWSGDINATFASLEAQIRLGLNLALSGVPHWGTDTGGFYRVGENDPELYARWFQFSAFCSIFRGHGFVWRQHLPWSYGEEVEEICRRYLELRSRLMPYTYALAWQARAQGLPMMRPLVLNYPDDPNVWDLGTQYLWGDDLLVAPVTRKCATQWTVYLPEGVWHDYWTQRAYQGPGGVTVPAPLETLPLFVRAGAIIPLGPVKQHDGDSAPDVLSLLIYLRGQGSFSLYEDDGISRAYLDGDYAITELSYRTDGESCIVSVSRGAGGTRPPSSNRRHVLQLFSQRSAREVALAGAKGGLTWWHDGTFLFVDVGAAPCSVRIDWS